MEWEAEKKRLLVALAWMAYQYLHHEHAFEGDPHDLDNICMSAGELAMEELARHGLVELEEGGCRFGRWTPEGRALLDEDIYS